MKRTTAFVTTILLCSCGPSSKGKVPPTSDNNGVSVSTNNAESNNATGSTGASNGSNNGSTTGTSNNGTVPVGSNNGTTTGATNNGTTNNGTTNNGTNNNGTNNNGTNNGTTNNGTNNMVCSPEPGFYGQIGGTGGHAGGTVSNTGVPTNANLDAVLAMVPTEPDDPATLPDEGTLVLAPPIDVTGAIVTATTFGDRGNSRFWVEDSTTALQLFLAPDRPVAPIRVGDEVSFTVLSVTNFEGHPQISSLQGFSIDSSGNPVPVREVGTSQVAPSDYNRIIRVAGTLSGGAACGGTSSCYDFTHPGGMFVYRTSSQFARPGDCVTFTGPLYSFPGPRQSASTPLLQADAMNFGWAFTPGQ